MNAQNKKPSDPTSSSLLELLVEPDGREQLKELKESKDLSQDQEDLIKNALELEDCLVHAFKVLEDLPERPSQSRIDAILTQTQETPPSVKTWKRIRRPVNTMLWVSVLLLSTLSLVSLAFLIFHIYKQLK